MLLVMAVMLLLRCGWGGEPTCGPSPFRLLLAMGSIAIGGASAAAAFAGKLAAVMRFSPARNSG